MTLAPPVWSAMDVRLSIHPRKPVVGDRISLWLRTYVPYVDNTRPCGFDLRPRRASYPFRVRATAPDGTAYRIRVRQGKGNLYTGTLRLSKKPGVWTIRVMNFDTRYNPVFPCTEPYLRFRVRP